jgi:hypothetical protein
MSRSGGNANPVPRGEAALLIHPKREALGVSIRLEGGQAPLIATNRAASRLLSFYKDSLTIR